MIFKSTFCRFIPFLFFVAFASTALNGQVVMFREGTNMGGVRLASLTNVSFSDPANADGSGQITTGAELAWKVRTRPVGFGGELSVALLFNPNRDDWFTSSDTYVELQLDYGLALGDSGLILTPHGDITLAKQEFRIVKESYAEINYLGVGGGMELSYLVGEGLLSLGVQYMIMASPIKENESNVESLQNIQIMLGYSMFL